MTCDQPHRSTCQTNCVFSNCHLNANTTKKLYTKQSKQFRLSNDIFSTTTQNSQLFVTYLLCDPMSNICICAMHSFYILYFRYQFACILMMISSISKFHSKSLFVSSASIFWIIHFWNHCCWFRCIEIPFSNTFNKSSFWNIQLHLSIQRTANIRMQDLQFVVMWPIRVITFDCRTVQLNSHQCSSATLSLIHSFIPFGRLIWHFSHFYYSCFNYFVMNR